MIPHENRDLNPKLLWAGSRLRRLLSCTHKLLSVQKGWLRRKTQDQQGQSQELWRIILREQIYVLHKELGMCDVVNFRITVEQ